MSDSAPLVLVERPRPHVAVVRMHRPNRLNAFDTTFIRDMRAILEDADADDDIRCLVVTGAPRSNGQPCFCAGGDLKETGRLPTFLLEVNDCFNRLEDMGKPSIAAIDGVCTAGGIELAARCIPSSDVAARSHGQDLPVANRYGAVRHDAEPSQLMTALRPSGKGQELEGGMHYEVGTLRRGHGAVNRRIH